jgi:hypothetical protein
MTSRLVLGVLLGLLVRPHSPTAAADPKPAPHKPVVKLGTIPDVKLTPRPAPDPAKVKRVKELIADLAKLDEAEVGLSATLGGHDFAPVPGQGRVGVLLLTDHRLKPSGTLRELVALGPDALPFLLDALDDRTPTKITITHNGVVGVMSHQGFLHMNPVNPAAEGVFADQLARFGVPKRQLGVRDFPRSYTVTVGDVCFVATGQIVGRGYSAVRYVPTGSIALTSPTHDAKLCATVRAIWAGKDPAKALFDSLLADYATEGIFNGRSLDGWSAGSDFPCGAALRLLYYFPQEAAPLIAGRLDKLDVTDALKSNGSSGWMQQCVANRVRADEFVKAVAWCEEPAVRTAVVRLFRRAEDYWALMAALPAIGDKALIRGRLEPLVDRILADGKASGSSVLAALAERTPDTAEAVFRKYLRDRAGSGAGKRAGRCAGRRCRGTSRSSGHSSTTGGRPITRTTRTRTGTGRTSASGSATRPHGYWPTTTRS